MTTFITRILQAAAFAATIASATAASAAGEPTGVWIDHTGRGAVEITNCGGSLCGKIVWLKDSAHNETCGKQVLGNVKPVGAGKWDNGWIYDVDEDRRYDVEITPMGDRLKVKLDQADTATGGLLFDVVEVIERVERQAPSRGHRLSERHGPRRPVAHGNASRDKRSRRRN